MLTKSLLAAGIALAAIAAPAQAAYTFNANGGDGFLVAPDNATPGGPWDFTIFGNDNGTSGIFTTNSMVASATTTVAGTFRYQTNDQDGSSFDPAGYFVNNVFTQLSVGLGNGGSNSGSFSFMANAGETFGFYVSSSDGSFGRGQLSVNGAVPEPSSWVMLIAGFGLVGAVARRRRSAALTA